MVSPFALAVSGVCGRQPPLRIERRSFEMEILGAATRRFRIGK